MDALLGIMQQIIIIIIIKHVNTCWGWYSTWMSTNVHLQPKVPSLPSLGCALETWAEVKLFGG